MQRITLFEHNGRQVIKVDLSFIGNNDELADTILESVELYSRFEPRSVYTIVDTTGITFDTESKTNAADWARINEAYEKYCYVVGATGVRKMMVKAVISLSGRDNMEIVQDEAAALELIGGGE